MEEKRRNQTNLVVGILLIGGGAITLVAKLLGVQLGAILWPFFIIGPGLLFFVGMVAGGKKMGGLAIPGSIITMTGLILLYQSLFDHFESWAYMWALIMPTAAGIGMVIHGQWEGLPALTAKGWRVIRLGLAIFLVMGFFFEVIIGLSSGPLMKILWPLLLIVLGGLLLLRTNKRAHSEPSPADRDHPSGE